MKEKEMRNRLIKIKDSVTQLYCIVNQFEEIDKEKCDEIGIPTNYRIINVFNTSNVCTFAGYNFNSEYFENKVYSEKYEGTFKAIGNVINSVSDIKYLPDTIDVEKIRNYYNSFKTNTIIIDSVLEFIREYDTEKLCKILFSESKSITIAIFDIEKKDCVFKQTEYTSQFNNAIVSYLWIPIRELNVSNIDEYLAPCINRIIILPKHEKSE